MENKVGKNSEFRPLQQLVPHQTDVLFRATTTGHTQLFGLIVPIAAAGASIMVLIVIVITMCFFKRRKAVVADIGGPSIVVYPSQQGAHPQFLTKDILFSLPALRPSNSLGDLAIDDDSDPDTESLLPAISSQRSNSFSCYGLGVIDPAMYRSASMEIDDSGSYPEGHLGRIWFSIRYEPATEKLLVSLLKAKNLPSRTVGTVNSCDPFVRLHLLPDERRYLQSKLKKKTCNPFFDETFIFQVSVKDILDHMLKLTVIDSGRAKRRSTIGHITLNLAEFSSGPEQKLFKMDLEKEVEEAIQSDLGEVLVSLVFNETLSRLAVTIIQAKRLKFKDEKLDSYVKVTLNQNYRPIKIKKTSTVKGSEEPDFSECFNFKLSADTADVSNLTFHVYQNGSGYGRDKLIGKFVIGSHMFARGKANNHWKMTFANPKEAVQQWHSLCM